jgi:hypothetical protein
MTSERLDSSSSEISSLAFFKVFTNDVENDLKSNFNFDYILRGIIFNVTCYLRRRAKS